MSKAQPEMFTFSLGGYFQGIYQIIWNDKLDNDDLYRYLRQIGFTSPPGYLICKNGQMSKSVF